jgi:hypothetical protein
MVRTTTTVAVRLRGDPSTDVDLSRGSVSGLRTLIREKCGAEVYDGRVQHRCTRPASKVRQGLLVCLQHAGVEYVRWSGHMHMGAVMALPAPREDPPKPDPAGVGWYLHRLASGGPVARSRAVNHVRHILETHPDGIGHSSARVLSHLHAADFRSIVETLVAAGEMTCSRRGRAQWYEPRATREMVTA